MNTNSLIYFDWSATSLKKPDAVKAAMLDAMEKAASAARGSYGPGLNAMRIMYQARQKVQKFFNASNLEHVVFTKNVTEAINLLINTVLHSGDHVISSVQEHNSVLRPLYSKASQGVDLDFLSCDAKGRVDIDKLSDLTKPETKLVILNHASNVTGNVIDLNTVADFCKEREIIFALDAAQSAGYIPIDLQKQGIDVLCFTGHKGLLGPQGSGGIIFEDSFFEKKRNRIETDSQIKPLISGGSGIHSFLKTMPDSLPDRLEAGTANIPALAGLAAGITYIEKEGLDNCFQSAEKLAKKFYRSLQEIAAVKTYGDYQSYENDNNKLRMPMVSLNIADMDAAKVAYKLWHIAKICVRPGAHCAPLIHKHFDTVSQGMVRFSFSHFNTEAEVEIAIEAINNIAQGD